MKTFGDLTNKSAKHPNFYKRSASQIRLEQIELCRKRFFRIIFKNPEILSIYNVFFLCYNSVYAKGKVY